MIRMAYIYTTLRDVTRPRRLSSSTTPPQQSVFRRFLIERFSALGDTARVVMQLDREHETTSARTADASA